MSKSTWSKLSFTKLWSLLILTSRLMRIEDRPNATSYYKLTFLWTLNRAFSCTYRLDYLKCHIFLPLKPLISPIIRWVIPVSSLCMIWVFPMHSPSIKNNTESSGIFLRKDVLILNGKENKEASAICFEIRIPKKNNKELL